MAEKQDWKGKWKRVKHIDDVSWNELTRATKRINDLEEDNTSLSEKLQLLNSQLEAQKQESIRKIYDLEIINKCLEKDLKESAKRFERAKITGLEKDNTSLSKRLQLLNSEFETHKDESTTKIDLKTSKKCLEKDLTEWKNKFEKAKKRITGLETDNKSLSKQLEVLNSEFGTHKAGCARKVEDIKMINKRLEKDLTKSQKREELLRSELQAYKDETSAEIEALSRAIRACNTEHDATKLTLSQIQNVLDGERCQAKVIHEKYQEAKGKLQRDFLRLEDDNKSLSKANKLTQQILQQQQQQRTEEKISMQYRIKILETENLQLQKNYDPGQGILVKQIAEKERETAEKTNELKTVIDSMDRSLRQKMMELEKVAQESSQKGQDMLQYALDNKQNPHMGTEMVQAVKDLPEAIKDKCFKIQHCVGKEMRKFGRELGVSEIAVEQIPTDLDLCDQFWTVIGQWSKMSLEYVSLGRLYKACEAINIVDGEAPMSKIHRDILMNASSYLTEKLIVNITLIYLQDTAVLPQSSYKYVLGCDDAFIKDSVPRSEQVRRLLEILPYLGDTAFDFFISALKQSGQEHVAVKLQEDLKRITKMQECAEGGVSHQDEFATSTVKLNLGSETQEMHEECGPSRSMSPQMPFASQSEDELGVSMEAQLPYVTLPLVKVKEVMKTQLSELNMCVHNMEIGIANSITSMKSKMEQVLDKLSERRLSIP